jgi:hypothetical protein
MATVVTINGINRSTFAHAGALTIEERLGARATLRGEIYCIDAQRPVPMHEITVAIDGTTYFSGPILGIEERASTDRVPNTWFKGLAITVTATDNNHYADRALTIPGWTGTGAGTVEWAPGGNGGANWTLKAIAQFIVNEWLNKTGGIDFDITLHPSQLDGPTFTDRIVVEWVTVTDCLNQLSILSGWIWSINSSKQLQFVQPTSTNRPFPGSVTLGTTNLLNDFTVKQEFADYCNSVFVLYKGPAWTSQEDVTQMGYYNRWMRFINAPEVTTAADANALALKTIERYGWLPKVVTCRTRLLGFHPGQRGTINMPQHGISSETYGIQAVRYQHIPVRQTAGNDAGSWFTELEALGGNQIPASFTGGQNWVDQWQSMVSGTNQSTVSISGATYNYTFSGSIDFQAYMGGSRHISVQHSGSYTPVPGYVDVTIDSAKYSGLTVSARVWLRTESAGTTVTPRIIEVDGGTVCGTGTASSLDTNWTTTPQQFTITLVTGVKKYRLVVQPSNATAGVYALGVLYV